MARKGVIKVYGGAKEEVNDAVRRWLENVGCMYYPYGEEGACMLKEELGFDPEDTVVHRRKKSMAVYAVYDGIKVDVYEYMEVEGRFRV